MDSAGWMAAAGLAVLAQGCAGTHADLPGGPLPAPPVIARGDRWNYVERNGYNHLQVGEVRFVASEAQDGRLVLSVTGSGTLLSAIAGNPREIYNCPWNVEEDAVYDRLNDYQPASPLVPWQAQPGDDRRDDSQVLRPEDRARDRWQVVTRFAGWERIKVPAGEFAAARIERSIFFDHPSFFRTDSERRETLWYAPEVKGWVRREWSGSYRMRGNDWFDRDREDWIVWELESYSVTPAGSGGAAGTHCGTPEA
ncbi:MAG: hypothetical protein HGA47_14465, partial [Zoogloea sp.]|nr:hypothetical protein [Zoogloea sp.]